LTLDPHHPPHHNQTRVMETPIHQILLVRAVPAVIGLALELAN
jgi:hypothetical protein